MAATLLNSLTTLGIGFFFLTYITAILGTFLFGGMITYDLDLS